MKTLRYKFDELWLVAINHTDMAPSLAELIIRNYIEEGIVPESDELTPGFRGVWTLIKAQIDQRKRRNLRARERRQEHRQHDTANPSITVISEGKAQSAKESEMTASSDVTATSTVAETSSTVLATATTVSESMLSRPSSVSCTMTSTMLPVSSPVAEIAPMVSSMQSISQKETLPLSRKVPFASRFRGPGLGAIRR